MANKNSPFGLRPIGKVGQNDDNQGLSEYSIAASSSAIYFGDPVTAAAGGVIAVQSASGATDRVLGSLNGVFYTDANTSKPTWANHLKASNTATDIVGFVADDPYERFEIQSDNTTASVQGDIFGGYNFITYAAGDSANYVSAVELDDSTFTTGLSQLKVIGVSKNIDNDEIGASHVNWVCMINNHFYNASTNGI
jgi:hypothetical protein